MARVQHGLPGIYNLTPYTLVSGEGSALSTNENGVLYITPAPGASFGASTADGSTFTQDTTAGTLAMGVYVASPQTLTTGDAAAVAVDVNRNLLVSNATKLAGEDLTLDVMKSEQRFSYSALLVADAQIKAGAGFIHTVTISCDDAAPTAGSIIVYDSLTETGTEIFNHTFTTTPFMPTTVTLDVSVATGIYAGFTTTADVNLLVSYR